LGNNFFRVAITLLGFLPVAAIVDQKIFCCHGGIPRAIQSNANILEIIGGLHRPLMSSDDGPDKILKDLMWGDPTKNEQEHPDVLFTPNLSRGEGMVSFGAEALALFLKNTKCEMLVRAHQYKKKGFKIHNEKLVTVFSSSGYCGQNNTAAVLVANDGKITVAVGPPPLSALPQSVPQHSRSFWFW
jgi:diadenosine tetraphosphatase ApaH/serine/threonine PP2A family protein phosphatase